MVWDEIVAFLPLAARALASVWLQLVAFGCSASSTSGSRFPSASSSAAEGRLGVMFDDLVAACYAYVVIAIVIA
jgi:phosphatidylglycerophosphatase A